MPENDNLDDLDPAASTQMFQAFVDRQEPESSGRRWMRVAMGVGAAVGLVVVVAIAWLTLG